MVVFSNLLRNTAWCLSLAAPKDRLCLKTKSQLGSQLLAVWPGYHELVEGERIGIRILDSQYGSDVMALSSGQVPSTLWSLVSNWNKGDWMTLVVFKFCCPLFEQNFMQNSKISVKWLKANTGMEAFGPYHSFTRTPIP